MRPVTAMNWTPSKKSGTSNCPRMSPRTTPRKSPRKPKPIDTLNKFRRGGETDGIYQSSGHKEQEQVYFPVARPNV